MKHSLRSLLAGCAGLLVMSPLAAQRGFASYELEFEATWSAATHPIQFPPGPHFSSLIGGLHSAATRFWQVGGLASPGMEEMAELGGTTTLRNEVFAEIAAGRAQSVLQFFGLATSPGSRTLRFTVTADHPRLTLVTMLAPSPDWFVGVDSLDLRPNGQWVDDLVVPLLVFDAGTDSGVSYRSPNANTVPPEPIAQVSTTSGPFNGYPGPVGTFTLRRLASNSVYGCGTNPDGSMVTISGPPLVGTTAILGLDDPTASMAAPAVTALGLSIAPDPAFPCGTLLPGLGLGGAAAGEMLLAAPLHLIAGPGWNGTQVHAALPIPGVRSLAGGRVYLQGVLSDGRRVGLTDAVELLIGR